MKTIETPWADRALIIVEDESYDGWFSDEELAKVTTFKLERRREEWLASRVAAKMLAMRLGLGYDPRTIIVDRPWLVVDGERMPEWQVSISHSHPYAAAAIARDDVGIDVQVVREIAEWSAHLFLTPDESAEMQSCTLPHRILHFWCAKEAAWKQHSTHFATMKQTPVRVVEEEPNGILFDRVETLSVGDLIVAITR